MKPFEKVTKMLSFKKKITTLSYCYQETKKVKKGG